MRAGLLEEAAHAGRAPADVFLEHLRRDLEHEHAVLIDATLGVHGPVVQSQRARRLRHRPAP